MKNVIDEDIREIIIKNDVEKFLKEYEKHNDYFCILLDKFIESFPIRKKYYSRNDLKVYLQHEDCVYHYVIIDAMQVAKWLNKESCFLDALYEMESDDYKRKMKTIISSIGTKIMGNVNDYLYLTWENA